MLRVPCHSLCLPWQSGTCQSTALRDPVPHGSGKRQRQQPELFAAGPWSRVRLSRHHLGPTPAPATQATSTSTCEPVRAEGPRPKRRPCHAQRRWGLGIFAHLRAIKAHSTPARDGAARRFRDLESRDVDAAILNIDSTCTFHVHVCHWPLRRLPSAASASLRLPPPSKSQPLVLLVRQMDEGGCNDTLCI